MPAAIDGDPSMAAAERRPIPVTGALGRRHWTTSRESRIHRTRATSTDGVAVERGDVRLRISSARRFARRPGEASRM